MKPIQSSEVEDYLNAASCFERDIHSEMVASKRFAHHIVYLLGILSLLAILAACFSFYQKAPDPYILRIDQATGAVDVLSQMKAVESTYGEVVDSYWLNQYVLNRESYDDHTIQTLYETTALLSSHSVQQEYYALFEGDKARDKVLGNSIQQIVHIHSIIPNIKNQTAVVRFTTQEKSSQGFSESKHFLATIGYQYKSSAMSVKDRRFNPLGFQVTSYRVDPEILNERNGSSR
jgi:type IV secretion system protein VirB8